MISFVRKVILITGTRQDEIYRRYLAIQGVSWSRMSKLSLYIFGSPRLELDGAVLEVKRRRVMALLVYLALTGRRHNREKLIDLLYHEQAASLTRNDFRQRLSNLKSLIGDDFVEIDRGGVLIPHSSDLWIDVVAFRDNLASAKGLGRGARFAAVLKRAIDLYRGEFLSGFYLRNSPGFETWQLSERRALEDDYLYTLKSAFTWHRSEEECDQSIEYANRLLGFDQLDESMHRDLMKIYDLVGRRSAAKRQYEECKTVLKRDLGINPSEETEQVYRNLRNRWGSTTAVKSALLAPNHNLPHRLEPLIGRDREKAKVRSLLS